MNNESIGNETLDGSSFALGTQSAEVASSQSRKQSSSLSSLISSFMSYLVFEAHGFRIGLEITLCMALYTLFKTSGLVAALGASAATEGLISWFSACSLLGIFDQFILCPAFYKYRQCYRQQLRGEYKAALYSLEQVSPYGEKFISCPALLYHQQRALILTHSSNTDAAFVEIERARELGLSKESYHIAKSYIYSALEEIEAAENELILAEQAVYGCPSSKISLARAFILFQKHNDYRSAKTAFEAVLSEPNEIHPSGEMTHSIATAFWESCRLWTGHAEEALAGLSISIERLKGSALYVETLRPLLATLLSERAYYYATHQEPEAAIEDLKACTALCAYPKVLSRISAVEEEVRWRYRKD